MKQKMLHNQWRQSCLVLWCLCLSLSMYAQQAVQVKGTVLDNKGEVVPGVTIVMNESGEKAMRSAITDEKGMFVFSGLKAGGTYDFQFSSIGFEKQTLKAYKVNAGDNNSVLIRLRPAASDLNQVVVTALGIKKEMRKLGYAVQKIDASEIDQIPATNLATSLSGKVAGMNVFNSPNLMQPNNIELRGRAPLIVIDGIPVNSNMYDINALDIENINVLKGATAAALYGSKGQNGAIQITTRSGKGGRPLEVNFSQRSVFRAGWIVSPKVQSKYGNGEQGKYAYYDGMGNGTFDNDFVWGPELDVKDPSTPSGWRETTQWDSPLDQNGNRIPTPLVSRGKNNLQHFLERGYTLSNNISMASSSDKGSFRVGFGYDYTNGEVPNTSLNNYNGSLAASYQLTDRLRVSANVLYNRQNSPNYPRIAYGNTNILYGMLIWAGTDVDIRDFRNYWQPGKENYKPVYFNYSWINNPYYMAYEQLQAVLRDRVLGISSADYKIANGLEAGIRQSFEVISTKDEMKYPKGYIGDEAQDGKYELTNTRTGEFNTELDLRYHHKWGSFGVEALAGANTNFRSGDNQYSEAQGLKVPKIYNLSNSLGPVVTRNTLTNYLRNSLFASVDLDYKQTYFLGLTARQDYSSALPSSHNSYFYPSISGAVMLSNIFKMPSSTFLKARASWAMVRADLDPYAYMTTYQPSIIYDSYSAVEYPATLGNNELRPQKTTGYELGLNGGVFNGRLTLDATYFRYFDTENIYDQAASLASGFTKYKINGNKFQRSGAEVTIAAKPLITKNVLWNTSVNWALYRQILKSVYGGADNLNGVKIGERMDKYMTNNTMMKSADGQLILGDNGLPVRDNVMKSLGYLRPDFTMSWSNNFTFFRRFQLGFLFEGRFGGIDQANMNRQMWYSGTHPNSVGWEREAYARGEKYTAQGVNVVSGTLVRDVNGNVLSDTRQYKVNDKQTTYKDFAEQYYYRMNGETNAFDLSFVKLREVSIGYELPKSFFERRKLGIYSASLSLIASNLFLISDFPMTDPDEGSGGTVGNKLQFPSTRNIGFNLNVKF